MEETTRFWHTAYLGIGSNMGDKEKNIQEALWLINDPTTKVTVVSSLITTKPVGYLDQDDFINACAKIKTLKNPHELLEHLLNIEKELKRERNIHWGPRTIDLDILLYNQEIMDTQELIIPHPRMHERLFVLETLEEIAPEVVHPIFKKTIPQLRLDIKKNG